MRRIALVSVAVLMVISLVMPATAYAAANQINGRLYWDKNNNGQQNTGEPGVAGVVVSFGYGTGQKIGTTDTNGNYVITGVSGSNRVTVHTGWLRSNCNSLNCSAGTSGGNDFAVSNQIISNASVNGSAGATLTTGLVPAWNGTYPVPTTYTPAATDIATRLTYNSGCTTTSVRTCATGSTIKLYSWFFNQGTTALTNPEFVVELPKGHTLNDTSWTDPKDVYNAAHPLANTITILDGFDSNKGYGRYRLNGTIPAGASSSMAFTAAVTASAVPTQTPYPTGEPFDKQAELRITHIDQSGDPDSSFCETNGSDWRTGTCAVTQLGVHDKTKQLDHTDGAGWNISGASAVARVHDLALQTFLAPTQNATVAAGDLVQYNVRVTNQGMGDAGVRNIKITDYVPSGMTFSPSDNPGWALQSGQPTTYISAQLLPGQSIDVPLALRTLTTIPETTTLRNQAEIGSFVRMNTSPSGVFMTASDVDSTPDTNPGNDGVAINNEITGRLGQTPNDEDDADFEDVIIGTPPTDPEEPPTEPEEPPVPPEPPVTPTLQEFVTNQSIETNLFGWTDLWGSATKVTQTTVAAYEGTKSLRVDTTSMSNTSAGVTNYQNRWVTSTVNSKIYTASTWVKVSVPGMKLCLRQTEYSGSSNVGNTETCTIYNDTNWHQLVNTKTAGGSGRSMTLSLYSPSIKSGQYFLADSFSITTPLQ